MKRTLRFTIECDGAGETDQLCFEDAILNFSLFPPKLSGVKFIEICNDCGYPKDECDCDKPAKEDLGDKADRLYEKRRDDND